MTEKKRRFVSLAGFCVFAGLLVLAFVLLNALPFSDRSAPIPYSAYVSSRVVGTGFILVLTGFALVRAYSYVLKPSPPWYRDGFLLAAIFFWALFPPTWFFTEYSLFEHGYIVLSDGSRCDPHEHCGTCKHELDRLKAYADLASKIWAGMAVLFATTVGLSKERDSPK